jgi:putative chitinase
VGRGTTDAIIDFQSRVLKMSQPDGRVDPGGKTLQSLRDGVPQQSFFPGHLQAIALDAGAGLIARFYNPLNVQMTKYGINTSRRRAHFLAQVCHESGQLRYTEELASGQAYEGRVDLGNTQQGDGPRFKRRGLIQLTGRTNYAALGQALNRDFTSDPNPRLLSTDPDLATKAACWFWNGRNLNGLADGDDIRRITLRVNGGLNGLAERQALYARARCIFNL